jgi:hypothetical protein
MSTAQKRKRRPSPTNSRKKLHTEEGNENTTAIATTTKPDPDAEYAEFAEIMRGIGVTMNDSTTPVLTPPVLATPVPPTPALPKPTNPMAGKMRYPAQGWGSSVHEQMHFSPTDAKKYHGVWGTKKLNQVRKWVNQACDSIYYNDEHVVASKPGEKGGYNFLVDMGDTTVGYLSGSSVPPGSKPPANYVAVYVNKNGYPTTAFPCTPDVFSA